MRKLLAGILLVLGLASLAAGWLGDTVWAPDTQYVATAKVDQPGAALVIDPGVLYLGGKEGTVQVKGEGSYSVIAARPSDAEAYFKGVSFTRVTGAESWENLSTTPANKGQSQEAPGVTTADLWESSAPLPREGKVSIAEWAKGENAGANARPYRSLVIANNGKPLPATTVTITWPTGKTNDWVPFAYAAGAVLAIIGLVLALLALTVNRDEDPEEIEDRADVHNEHDVDDESPTEEAEQTRRGSHRGSHRAEDSDEAGTDVLTRHENAEEQR